MVTLPRYGVRLRTKVPELAGVSRRRLRSTEYGIRITIGRSPHTHTTTNHTPTTRRFDVLSISRSKIKKLSSRTATPAG